MKIRTAWAVSIFILIFAGVQGFAQTATGTISGQVTDPSGALVPGVNITVTNSRTGFERTTQTNESGEYTVTFLVAGEYQVTAEKQGFKKFVRTGIVLTADQNSRQDIALVLGSAAETVEVAASSEQFLKLASSDLGDTILEQQFQELPLNSRNFMALAPLNPGITPGVPGGQYNGIVFGLTFSVNGLRDYSNNFMMDGLDNNVFTLNSPWNVVPIDGVQEFNVATNNFSAQYGRSAAGVINLVMKSGSNQFHGTAFEFFQNDALNANDFFSNKTGVPKQPFHYNQFGGSFGGPIQKDKTFFFIDYNGRRTDSNPTTIHSVPPVAWRNGNFSDLLQQGIQLYDPTTVTGQAGPFPLRAAFAGDIIPPSKQNPAGKAILALYPAPNLPGSFNNYVESTHNTSNPDDADLKIDHQFSPRDTIFGRYNMGYFHSYNTPFFGNEGGGGAAGQTAGPAKILNQQYGFGYNHIFTPTLVNEFRFGYLRGKPTYTPPGFGRDLNTQLGIPGINVDQNSSGLAWLCPDGFSCLGDDLGFPIRQTVQSLQWVDNVSKQYGRHSMKAGFSYMRRSLDNFQAIFPRGLFFFQSFTTGQIAAGGNPIASLLTGYEWLGIRDILNHYVMDRSWEMGMFFQDDFRVNNRLTLNLGLRYDYFSPYVEVNNQQSNFDPATVTMLLAGQNGNSRSLVNGDKKDFAPRVGFAYSLTGDQKTVLRGGFGISYVPEREAVGALDQLAYNIPFYYSQTFVQVGLFTPSLSLSNGLPTVTTPNPNQPFGTVKYQDPNMVNSQVQYWNLDIQREIFPNMLLDVAYAGTHGVHLLQVLNPNQPPPGPTQVYPISSAIAELETFESRANSIYHSLQIKLNKRLSKGFSFSGSYTWSKAIDDSVGFWSVPTGSVLPQDSTNLKAERGLSANDIRHRFVISYDWELPVGRGKAFLGNANSIVNVILGGWQMTGITVMQSGVTFTPIIAANQANTANGGELRPNRIASGSISNPTVDHWFDVSAFTLPALFTYGNSGRNILTGPRLINFDWGLYKNFSVTEKTRLQFRAEFYNLFNTPHFAIPNRVVDVPGAGTITALANPPRQIQLALKFMF